MNLSGWMTFKEIVDSIMLAVGDSSDQGQFMRYLNFAIRGYEQLRLHNLPATKPVTLPIETELRIVVLPDDFLKFVSVGVYSEGVFYKFLPKSDMVYVVESSDGVDTRSVPSEVDTNGGEIVRFIGCYSLDIENRRILIDAPLALTEVLLNYTPTGVKMDGMTYIPRMCREVLEAYVEYQVVLRDKNRNMADRITFEKEYLKALMKFQGLQFNTDEIFQEYYDHLAAGPKY
jgi:hypothetical protein